MTTFNSAFGKPVPFDTRTFTVDGERCDIEDFISSNSATFEDARVLREDLAALNIDYHMYVEGLLNNVKHEYDVYRLT
jgi:hypothetical protein